MIGAPRHGTVRDATFLQELVAQFRAQGGNAAWDGRSDWELLAPLIVSRDRKDDGPLDDLDPDVFWRIELFYNAVGRAIEMRSGVACTLMMKMHHEGFGRLVLLAGRLVVLNRFLRDVRRFGYESLEKLNEAGERLVAGAIDMIGRFPDAARYDG
jgi:probable nitrogen fixation protein